VQIVISGAGAAAISCSRLYQAFGAKRENMVMLDSKGVIRSPEMLLSMANNPIVFAMANPNPEVKYDVAIATRKDIIMATEKLD